MIKTKICLYAIVVIYNKNIRDSITLNSIKLSKYKILVIDNSLHNYDNALCAEQDGFEYISMNGNKGLSKAYNTGIKYLKDKASHITLFDDDTEVTTEFIEKILEVVSISNADVILPIIYSNDAIISPSKTHDFSRKFKEVSEIYKKSQISAINSAMTISIDVFLNYKYDENLFLDYVDHRFMNDMNNSNKLIEVLDVSINQNFSMDETGDKEDLPRIKARYNLFFDDIKYYFKGQNLKRYIEMLKYGLRISISYRNMNFLVNALFLRKFK